MRNRELYQEITETIVTQLKSGTKPWESPWVSSGTPGFPMNGHRHRRYNGINVLTLWATAAQQHYESHIWLTYRQSKQLGGHVRKGEQATKVVYWKVINRRSRDQEAKEDADTKNTDRIPLLRYYNVFNLAQIDGVTLENVGFETPEIPDVLKDNDLALFDTLRNALQADIQLGGTQAYYQPSTDQIHLPDQDRFTSAERFYSTLFHELGHWTGHPTRLDRDLNSTPKHSDRYAWEELIAELTAAYLATHFRIQYDDEERKQYEQSAAYLNSWIQALEAEPYTLFKAARSAEEATEYLRQQIPMKS